MAWRASYAGLVVEIWYRRRRHVFAGGHVLIRAGKRLNRLGREQQLQRRRYFETVFAGADLLQDAMPLDFLNRRLDPLVEAGAVGIRTPLVNAHVFADLVNRDYRPFALRIGLAQPLPQMQQHD